MTISGREHALRIVAAIVLATVLAAGCIGMQPSSTATASGDGLSSDIPQPGLERLRGPWQAEPFALEPAIAAAAEQECRRGGFGRALALDARLRVADARGGSRLFLIFAGDGSGYGNCELEILPDGGLMQNGGSMQPDGGPGVAVGPDQAIPRGGGGVPGAPEGEAWYFVYGELGDNVAQVLARTRGRVAVATVGDGWFIAWWPGRDRDLVIEAYAQDGSKLGEVPW